MSFPEWGYSYNALYVPLCMGWQCALMPVREMQEVDRAWFLSFEERKQKKKERSEQIEQDRQDFDRLFRVSIDRRGARTSSDFREYLDFINRNLRASGWDLLDGEGITRVLRDAARDGRVIPVISRNWCGSRRIFKHYAPQRWAISVEASGRQRASEVMNWREFEALRQTSGEYGMSSAVAASSLNSAASFASEASIATSGNFNWLSVIESAGGAIAGAALSGTKFNSAGDSMLRNFGNSDGSDSDGLLGDASPFQYVQDDSSGDAKQLAASTNNPRYAAKMLGYDYKTFGTILHKFKDANGLGPADNSIFHDNGDVEFNGKIFEDSFHDYAP